TEKKLAPPLALSLIVMRHLFAGKPAETLVSSKKMRRLFSRRTIVSKPNPPGGGQSKPTHRLPLTLRSCATATPAGTRTTARSADRTAERTWSFVMVRSSLSGVFVEPRGLRGRRLHDRATLDEKQ